MVDSAAIFFLETVRELIHDETKLLGHGSDEVKQANRDLKKIHDLLMKADADRRDSPGLAVCVAELRYLAFVAEDVLETYLVEAESKKLKGWRSLKLKEYNCITCELSNAGKVRKRTRAVISRLANLSLKLESEFESSNEDGQFLLSRSRQTYAHEVEHDVVVGMEKDIELIVSMVKDESPMRGRVIKICGMGGIGKTTLARKIYNHPELKSYARAWVCITQDFQAKAVFGQILKQLDDKAAQIDVDGMGVEDLVMGIYRFLEKQRRRCLVVIDDIWENDDWNIIKKAFPINCNVVLTTRLEDIANGECHPYKLYGLPEDQAWDLLRTIIALPQDFAPDLLESLEDIGRKIVVKCGGLPLSISVIGKVLRRKGEHSLAEWKKVYMSYFCEGEYVEADETIRRVLDLSYNALPYFLKPCLLYLACFPREENIKIERLYLLWMAEGLLSYQHKGPNETLRDVAQRYATELARRSMVQVVVEDESETYSSHDHKSYSYRLHDLIHQLCTSEFEKENLLNRLDVSRYLNVAIPSSTAIRLAIPPSIGNSISRLAINNDGNAAALVIDGLEELKDLRSFVLLGEGGYSVKRVCFDDSTMNFERSQYLRILVLDNCDFAGGRLPRKVSKLIHLRYLSLKFSNLRVLPQFVCSMPYLQTLDLRVLGFMRLPNLIWKMKRLKHLFLPCLIEVIGGEKLRLDGLVELETLQNMESMTACTADIPKLTSLLTLSVAVNDIDSMGVVARHMRKVKCPLRETHLKLQLWGLDKDLFENVLICPSLLTLRVLRCNISGGLPHYKQGMCRNLVKLELFHCTIEGDVAVMEELGMYPMLQILELERVKIDKMAICRSNSFPQLKSLTLSQIPNLVKWVLEGGALPKLTQLSITSCCSLEKVPDGLRFVSTLRLLSISGMPREFNDRVGVRGQDYGTVSHIPSIKIID